MEIILLTKLALHNNKHYGDQELKLDFIFPAYSDQIKNSIRKASIFGEARNSQGQRCREGCKFFPVNTGTSHCPSLH